jgi:hypothetical protein
MLDKFTYNEALLGLTTIIAWSDGENHKSQIDVRVNMILNEGITNTEIDIFKSKYEEINSFDKIYKNSIEALKKESAEKQNRAMAYMWQIAAVSSPKEETLDLDYITDNWENKTGYVDLEELKWINMARHDLGVKLSDFKREFAALPESKRI